MSTSSEREDRLRALFAQYSTRVLAYALRHVGPSAAQDVVGDVFVVAWRRLDDVPDDPVPWLLVVARNTVANRRRGVARQQRLERELGALELSMGHAVGADQVAIERAAVFAALAELSTAEREALLLVAWDGLSAQDAASVVGCSRHAFEVRLHRARNRLRRELTEDDPNAGNPVRKPSLKEFSL
ncbi:MAG: RNA polymerase subunit sigma-24 [Pseudonocardiales bacterium]|nr:MAG: RNA polymerase subunit sigma-24 [Pseudonocardiales bacterium]